MNSVGLLTKFSCQGGDTERYVSFNLDKTKDMHISFNYNELSDDLTIYRSSSKKTKNNLGNVRIS